MQVRNQTNIMQAKKAIIGLCVLNSAIIASNLVTYKGAPSYQQHYVLNENCQGLPLKKECINICIDGYTLNEKEENSDIMSVSMDLQKNITRLAEISILRDNWNENGAKSFSKLLLEKVRRILIALNMQPEIFPTAANSIQLEYEKENGEYLEFNVYLEYTDIYKIDAQGKETERSITTNELDQISELVEEFYA